MSSDKCTSDTDRFDIWSCDDCGIEFGYPSDIVASPWMCPKCGCEEVQHDV